MTDPDPDIQATIELLRANLAKAAATDHEPQPSPPRTEGHRGRARMSRVILAEHRDAIGRRRRIGHSGRPR